MISPLVLFRNSAARTTVVKQPGMESPADQSVYMMAQSGRRGELDLEFEFRQSMNVSVSCAFRHVTLSEFSISSLLWCIRVSSRVLGSTVTGNGI